MRYDSYLYSLATVRYVLFGDIRTRNIQYGSAGLFLFTMAKADSRKDYYADLGLAPNAESEDIKKQFRKLGGCEKCAMIYEY